MGTCSTLFLTAGLVLLLVNPHNNRQGLTVASDTSESFRQKLTVSLREVLTCGPAPYSSKSLQDASLSLKKLLWTPLKSRKVSFFMLPNPLILYAIPYKW